MNDEAGEGIDDRLVRPYLVTGGRTRSQGTDLPLETLVTTTARGVADADAHVFEHRQVLEACHTPLSIAEVAATLQVPAGVARVLIGDLVATGMLQAIRRADTNEDLIRRLIDGVRSL